MDFLLSINARAVMWTLDSLDEDHELERFFSGLPGFRNSKVVEDPLPSLNEEQKWKLSTTLMGLLDRTFSSDLLPESIKSRRVIICARAFPQADIPDASSWILQSICYPRYEGLRTAELGRIVRGWADSLRGDEYIAAYALAIVSGVIALAQRRNDSWFILASEELGVPESVLRNHATHGDSLSLAILIHLTRQQFSHFRKTFWPEFPFSFVLSAASKLNAQDTSRELQHEFCALWNQIVRKAQNDNDRRMAAYLLRPIRNVYITLHQDTDSAPTQFSASTPDYDRILSDPSTYPLCNVTGHHSHSTPHNHNDSASAALAHAIPHHSNALVIASPANSDVHSSSISVVENLTDVSSLDNPHPPHRKASKGLLIPASLDPAAVGAMPHLAPETSTSTPPLSPISPPAITPQHSGDFLTLNLPSSDPVLDNPLPAESLRSMRVPTVPGVSPGTTSAPDLDATADGDGSPKPGSCKEKDTLDPPSVNHAIHIKSMATPMLNLSSSPPSVPSDEAISGSSQREPNAEHRADYPPDPSHCQYDMV